MNVPQFLVRFAASLALLLGVVRCRLPRRIPVEEHRGRGALRPGRRHRQHDAHDHRHHGREQVVAAAAQRQQPRRRQRHRRLQLPDQQEGRFARHRRRHADGRLRQAAGPPAGQPPRRDDGADDRRHRRADAVGAHRVALQDGRGLRRRRARQAGPAHRRRHRHAQRGPHLRAPVRAGGQDQAQVRAVQFRRRGDGGADGRPHRRRHHESRTRSPPRSRPARRRTWRSPRSKRMAGAPDVPTFAEKGSRSTGSRCAASSGRPTWRPRPSPGGRTR